MRVFETTLGAGGATKVSAETGDARVEVRPLWSDRCEVWAADASGAAPETVVSCVEQPAGGDGSRAVLVDGRGLGSSATLVLGPPQASAVAVTTRRGSVALLDKIEGNVVVTTESGDVAVSKARGDSIQLLSARGRVQSRSLLEGNLRLFGRSVDAKKLLAYDAEIVADDSIRIEALYATVANLRCGAADDALDALDDAALEASAADGSSPPAPAGVTLGHVQGALTLRTELPVSTTTAVCVESLSGALDLVSRRRGAPLASTSTGPGRGGVPVRVHIDMAVGHSTIDADGPVELSLTPPFDLDWDVEVPADAPVRILRSTTPSASTSSRTGSGPVGRRRTTSLAAGGSVMESTTLRGPQPRSRFFAESESFERGADGSVRRATVAPSSPSPSSSPSPLLSSSSAPAQSGKISDEGRRQALFGRAAAEATAASPSAAEGVTNTRPRLTVRTSDPAGVQVSILSWSEVIRRRVNARTRAATTT